MGENKPFRVMVDIGGDAYDFWEIRTITKTEQYNDERENLDYQICINGASDNLQNSAKQQYVNFDTLEERDDAYKKLIIDLKQIGVIIV